MKAIGAGTRPTEPTPEPVQLPKPLASVVDYLAEQPDGDREFVPTAELVEALDVDPTEFARQMTELGCRPTRDRITENGQVRQVRGYRVTDVDAVVDAIRTGTVTEEL
jgi:DNA segregation ATPase FtsK/SpoIIIE, S-DNA-T family